MTQNMPRRPAKITQADVARTIRAAKQAGAAGVEITAEGTIRVLLSAPEKPPQASNDDGPDRKGEIVL